MIVVTGMHRSGTSLACQLLAALGVSFGPVADHFPSDRWNPAGYFEVKAVMDTNSRIVTGLPRNRSRLLRWASKLVYLRMPAAAAIAARAAAERPAIERLGQCHRDGAVKDPRFCLTLRYWRQWAPVSRVLVCLRHPGAVVESLARRDRLPRGLGARFYAYHLEALLAQLPVDAVFADMDRLAAGDAGELDAVRRGLGLDPGVASSTLLRDTVQPQAFAAGAAAVPPSVVDLWQRLQALAARSR